VSNCVD